MRWLLFGLVLLLFFAGCGSGTGKISGRMLYKGEPLPGGRVMFRPADPKQNPVAAMLDEQGNYEATLPVGEVLIAVDNRDLQPRSAKPIGVPPGLPAQARQILSKAKPQGTPPPPANRPTPAKPAGKYIALPPKYYTTETSGLALTVEPGDQKQDIDLK